MALRVEFRARRVRRRGGRRSADCLRSVIAIDAAAGSSRLGCCNHTTSRTIIMTTTATTAATRRKI
eukprot:scaffold15921_cov85-Skeletonema_marinoi.AAC.1